MRGRRKYVSHIIKTRGFLDEILQALVPLIIQFLGLNLKLFHGDEILNKRLSEGIADDVIVPQGLQGVVKLHRNGKLLLLTGGFVQTAVDVEVSSDAVQSCGRSSSQDNVRVGHG